MWIATERLQQGESLNKQNVKTNLFWEFGRFTSRDGESIESYYSRFYKMMNEMVRNQLEVATMQYKKKVNEIRADKIARNANPLALVAAAQQYPDTYYQPPKSHKSYAPLPKQSSSTRSHLTTRHKGKKIAKPIIPQFESAYKEDSDLEQAQKDKEMQKNLALIAKYFKKIYQPTNNNLKSSLNTINKNVGTSPRYKNDNQTGKCRNQRTMTVFGARETVEQSDWLDDTDENIDEQELEAHYNFMAKIQEIVTAKSRSDVEPLEKVQSDTEYNVFANERQHFEQPKSTNDTYVVEKVDSNVIPNSSGMRDNDSQADQNAEECDDERAVLANLIENLKLDTDENKKIQKKLKKANTSLAHEWQECKFVLEKCKSSLEESNRTRDRYLGTLHDQEVELAKYKRFNDCTPENDRLKRKLKETLGLLAQKEIDSQEVLKTKGYEISMKKEKNNELVKQSSFTTSR
nr:hypothetical protein [Tanacetum cinerariifolium]